MLNSVKKMRDFCRCFNETLPQVRAHQGLRPGFKSRLGSLSVVTFREAEIRVKKYLDPGMTSDHQHLLHCCSP